MSLLGFFSKFYKSPNKFEKQSLLLWYWSFSKHKTIEWYICLKYYV